MTKHPLLSELGAYRDGALFAETHPTLQAAWDACERPDWLLWFACRRKVERKTLVRIACDIARLALPHAKAPCVLACIEVTERWCDDKATLDEVRAARDAAAYAAYAASTYASTYAAASAASAAASAASAAYADAADAAYADAAYADAADAADAAYAYADAADAAYAYADAADAAYASARAKTKAQCCAIIRKHLPTAP